jgi:hypothetical protein
MNQSERFTGALMMARKIGAKMPPKSKPPVKKAGKLKPKKKVPAKFGGGY